MRPYLPTTLVLGLAAAALFTGCGEDEDSVAVDETDFAREADSVCRKSQAEFNRIQRTGTSTPAQAERQVEALVDVSEEAVGELRKLSPPDELRPDMDRYLAAREQAIAVLEQARRAAAESDFPAYLEAKRRVAARAGERLRLARALGLRQCSRPSISLGRG
jgi:hypothetical protein